MGAEWKRFAKLLQPGRFTQSLHKHVGSASRKLAPKLAKAMRLRIRQATTAKNAALTIAVKRSSKPLVDFGDLFKAVTARRMAWDLVFAGVLRTAAGFNIAVTLHEGHAVPVTPKMRGLFLVLAQASRAKAEGYQMPKLIGRAAELFARFQSWYPLRPSTRMIKIPPRPFARETVDDPKVRKMVVDDWSDAVQRALAE
jgi:hypothetical protein